MPVAFLQNLNPPEIIMIFAVVLLFFGAKRLPELFRSFGKSVREFKRATHGIEDDIRTAMNSEEPETQKPATPAKPAETVEAGKSLEAAEPAAPEAATEKPESKA